MTVGTGADRGGNGLSEGLAALDVRCAGEEVYELARVLFPLCRSITGSGLRRSLEILAEVAPLELRSVPSGTRVYDWTVPPEWNLREARVCDPRGRKVIDFAENNLHVMGCSVPGRARMSLEALRAQVHCLPDQPELIPDRKSYSCGTRVSA